MGRRAQGIRFRPVGGIWTVRFRIAGKRHEYSTGVKVEPRQRRPSEAAVREGEQIYASCLQGKRIVRAGAAPTLDSGSTLAELFAEWLEDLTVRAATAEQYEVFTVQWLREWKRVSEMTEASVAAYFRRRLREVIRKSVANEASALRKFSAWGVETGAITAPIVVPKISKSVTGTPYKERRRTRAPELSAAEVEAILALLPEWSGLDKRKNGLFPVRARFELMFETTLRPATLDKLSVPEHWAPGERVIRLDASDDKEGYEREIPLTEPARKALERVAPEAGIIFGAHKYHRYLGPAAAAVLPAAKARIFTGQHVRSAAITRALERSSNLAGVMHLAGHKHASTTSKYVRPTFRAALDVIGAFDSGELSGEKPRKRAAK